MRYVGTHLARFFVVLFLATSLTALLLDFVPGNAAEMIVGENATPDQIAAIERQLGLDRPILERYLAWLGGVVQGDFGTSYRTGTPVLQQISERLPVTIELAVLAILLALVLSVLFAVVAVMTDRSPVDRTIQATSSALLAVPSFVLGLLLVYFFAITLGWFPVQGWQPLGAGWANIEAIALPVLTLAIGEAVVFQRVLRAGLQDTLGQDYVLLARSKGLTSLQVLLRHCLRPSSVPLFTLAGLSFARLLGGTIIVESIFSLPGLGSMMINSVRGRDIIAVQGLVFVIALGYLLINLLVDLLYGLIDPRMRRRTS